MKETYEERQERIKRREMAILKGKKAPSYWLTVVERNTYVVEEWGTTEWKNVFKTVEKSFYPSMTLEDLVKKIKVYRHEKYEEYSRETKALTRLRFKRNKDLNDIKRRRNRIATIKTEIKLNNSYKKSYFIIQRSAWPGDKRVTNSPAVQLMVIILSEFGKILNYQIGYKHKTTDGIELIVNLFYPHLRKEPEYVTDKKSDLKMRHPELFHKTQMRIKQRGLED